MRLQLSYVACCFFLVSACWRVDPLHAQAAADDPRHLNIIRGMIGVTEDRLGSNSGSVVNRILRHVGLAPGNEWCAATGSFILDSAGVITPTVRSGLARRFKTRDAISAKDVYLGRVKVKPGWIVGWIRGRTIKGHLAFADKWGVRSGSTIEGNTSNPVDGKPDGIFAKQRTIAPGAYFRIDWFTPVIDSVKAYQ